MIVNPLHHYYRLEHLEHVVGEMRRLGPPVLRGYWDAEWRVWHAAEGTHRLRAALRLGLVPVMVAAQWTKGRTALQRARLAAVMRAHVFGGPQAPESRW